MIKRIGILTGGGDAPGLNAAIRAVALTAINVYGWEVLGLREGFDGLVTGLEAIPLTEARVRDILDEGGTILGAASRGNPFARRVPQADGSVVIEDVSREALARLDELGIDALIVAGGDGTMQICQGLCNLGAKIVGVPKTIDNDLSGTDSAFGFDSALGVATDALDRLRTTAESHHRVMILEVMGRNAGWIALLAGLAGGADAILMPEIPFDVDVVCEAVSRLRARGRRHSLIVVAEGAAPIGGQQSIVSPSQDPLALPRLGGIGNVVAAQLQACVDAEVRTTILGHLQRGGRPSPYDRWLATRFGANAVHQVARGAWGQMVALRRTEIVCVPIAEAVRTLKRVDPQGEAVHTARGLGIVFG